MRSIKESDDKSELTITCECGNVYKIYLDDTEKPVLELIKTEKKEVEKRKTILFKKVE